MPSLNPTTPNLLDYQAFLYGSVGIPVKNLPSVSGAASGGSTTTLVDSSQTWAINQWVGYSVYDATQGWTAVVESNTATTLTFIAQALPAVVADRYAVVSDSVSTSMSIAQDVVNDDISGASAQVYVLAVYNLAADRLINYAIDVPNQSYFVDLRKNFNISNVSVGVASSVNDQGTAVGILNPEQMKLFTLSDLQTLKTPVGRAYMGIAQTYGRSLWGLS